MKTKNSMKIIQSVQRASDIINYVADSTDKVTLREISDKLNINPNTARGIIQTLLVNGYLSKDHKHSTYDLGYEFFNKGRMLYIKQFQLIMDTSSTEMRRISNLLNVTLCLQLNFNYEIYTTEIITPTRSPYSYAPNPNTNLPLHASASGKLLIAYLPDNERQKLIDNIPLEQFTEYTITSREVLLNIINTVYNEGYATEIDELCPGISSIAVPIFDVRYLMKGTISIVAPTVVVKNNLRKSINELKHAAERISDRLVSLSKKMF